MQTCPNTMLDPLAPFSVILWVWTRFLVPMEGCDRLLETPSAWHVTILLVVITYSGLISPCFALHPYEMQ